MVSGDVPGAPSGDVPPGDPGHAGGTVSSGEWMNTALFTIVGIAVLGLLTVIVGVFLLDKIGKLSEEFVAGVIVVGAGIMALSGILWMITAVLMIASVVARWKKGRSG